MEKLKNYFEFIRVCRDKIYSGDTNTHHIIPKHMGGANDDNNLIKLSYGDHYKAHIVLAECFDVDERYYKTNIHSANLLTRWVNCDNQLLEKLSKLKTKQLYEWWGNLSDEELTNYKRKMSTSSKNMWGKLSKEKINERNKKISNKLKGRAIFWKDKISKNHSDVSGEKNPMYGKKQSETTKYKISNKLKGNSNLGGRKGKTFSTFKFYLNNNFIYEANGQKDAKQFCLENNISFQTLCKKDIFWNNWSCERNKIK